MQIPNGSVPTEPTPNASSTTTAILNPPTRETATEGFWPGGRILGGRFPVLRYWSAGWLFRNGGRSRSSGVYA